MKAMAPRYRRSPRLKDFDYGGPLAAHLTFVTRRREPIFGTTETASACVDALRVTAARFLATLHAYCVMPDHVHVLVEIPAGVSLEKFAKYFKQISGYRLKIMTGTHAWQISYHDHILRREENLLDVARYIWQNPVREGLAASWQEYPYCGPRERLAQA